jgi:hypothetical protein
MSPERDPLSLVGTLELLGRKSSGSCIENGEYGRGDPTSDGRSVGIVRSQTQTTEFVSFCKRPKRDIQNFTYFNLHF